MVTKQGGYMPVVAAEIDEARVIQFSSEVHVKAQQMKSRLMGMFEMRRLVGKQAAYDSIGGVDAKELTGRFNEADFTEVDIERRKIGRRRFSLTLPVDSFDVEAVLLSPDAQYSSACARAMARVYDRIALEATLAPVFVGEDMDTLKTFTNDGGSTVTATSGLTYDSLLAISQTFLDNDVGTDLPENFSLCVSGKEMTALMKETELTSGDFSRHYVVDKGVMVEAVGMRIIRFAANAATPMLKVTSGVRDCVVFTNGAVCFGMPKAFSIKVEQRTDYVETHQIQAQWTLGAVRTEGKLVQKVTTTS